MNVAKLNQFENVYEFVNDQYVALFNSSNMETVYINKAKYDEFSHFEKDKQTDFLNECGLLGQKEIAKNNILYIGSMYLLLTTDCNLNCEYCTVKYNHKSQIGTGYMDEQIIDSALALLVQGDKSYVRQLNLYGGEPLLNKEGLKYTLAKVRKYIDEGYKIKVSIITNGVLIDKEIAEILKENNVFPIVSMDGLEKHHNHYRVYDEVDYGCYNETRKGYNLLRESGNKTGISLVMGNHNIRELADICKHCKEDLNVDSIGVTLPHLYPTIDSDVDWAEEGVQSLEAALDKCCELDLWNEQLMKKIVPLINKEIRSHGCPAPKDSCMIRVLPDGNVTLCENLGLRHLYNIGNIKEIKELEEVTNNNFVREWYERTPFKFDECKDCYASGICGAGCPYDAYLATGSINGIEKRNCHISKMLVSWFINKAWKEMDNKADAVIKPDSASLGKVIPKRSI